jgi:FlaA1/EpsC-like NDP-sugar epimerase
MILDLILVAVAVWGSFALRLGSDERSFEHARLFALRVAPWLFFAALITFRFYRTAQPLWRVLVPAVLLGGAALAGFMYIGWRAGWLEGFSRTILLLGTGLTFALLYGSRLLLRLWRPQPALAEKQA